MARSPLSFATSLHISLMASPYRMLTMEGKTIEEAANELYSELLEYPKRTVHEVRRYGPGTPKARTDVLAQAIEDKRMRLKEELDQWGRDLHRVADQLAVLERLVELAPLAE